MQTRREFVAAGVAAAAGSLMPARGAASDLAGFTLKQASDALRSKMASPVDLTNACLARIDRYDSALKTFITITRDQALAQAREMEEEMRRGKWRGPLHGIPIALK